MEACPKCGGKLFLEDRVLFCEDCAHVVDRNFVEDCDVGKPTFYGKREKEISKMMRNWKLGKVVSHKVGGIKGRIYINKHGNICYGYMRHMHGSST